MTSALLEQDPKIKDKKKTGEKKKVFFFFFLSHMVDIVMDDRLQDHK